MEMPAGLVEADRAEAHRTEAARTEADRTGMLRRHGLDLALAVGDAGGEGGAFLFVQVAPGADMPPRRQQDPARRPGAIGGQGDHHGICKQDARRDRVADVAGGVHGRQNALWSLKAALNA